MKLCTATFCLLFFVLAGTARGRDSKAGDWINITPGTSLKGWTRVAIPPSHPLNPVSQWKLNTTPHAIVCEGNGGHEWLRYGRQYKDFIFEVQWKLTNVPGVNKYNSGVFVRNNASGSIWYQAQVGSTDGGYFFGENPENGAVKRFNLRSSVTVNHMKPQGSWNTYKIKCVGKTLSLWVNGVKQIEFTQCNNLQGYVGLEAEGSRIEFRGLKIKVLP